MSRRNMMIRQLALAVLLLCPLATGCTAIGATLGVRADSVHDWHDVTADPSGVPAGTPMKVTEQNGTEWRGAWAGTDGDALLLTAVGDTSRIARSQVREVLARTGHNRRGLWTGLGIGLVLDVVAVLVAMEAFGNAMY